MASIDIFRGRPFHATELSEHYATMPYAPTRVQEMGLFTEKGHRTTSFYIERSNGVVLLLPYEDPDGPDTAFDGKKREKFDFNVGHFTAKRTIKAREIQDMIATGSESELFQAQDYTNEKLEEMLPSHETTLEYQKVGAICGRIVNPKDASVVYDLYSLFGIGEPTVEFDLDVPTTDVKAKATAAVRLVEAGLGMYRPRTIRAFCGPTFYDAFVGHASVKDAFDRWQDGAFKRDDLRFSGFAFGGIIWEEYRSLAGTPFLGNSECRIFPEGIPGQFLTGFGPMNHMEYVNKRGLRRYASIHELPHGRGVEVLTESDPMSINCRPESSVKGNA
jgi:hypothetical protein